VFLRGYASQSADGRMRPSLRERRAGGNEKQIPPLRPRIRSGSGRNEGFSLQPNQGCISQLSALLYKYLYTNDPS